MSPCIAIVGGGPTAVYLVQAFLGAGFKGALTIYESGSTVGMGMPYDPAHTHPSLLANISGLEIPPVGPLLHDWANDLPADRAAGFDVEWPMTGRTFPPRVLLGAYLADGLDRMVAEAGRQGLDITLRPETRVTDVGWDAQGVIVSSAGKDAETSRRYDHVVLATGHVWPPSDQAGHGRYASPWPTAQLRVPDHARVAVLGSSLSAIDAAVTLAMACGRFISAPDGLAYELAAGRSLEITFFSRGGFLPEADFFCIMPHLPLTICTASAVAQSIAQGSRGLLDRIFDLIQAELHRADPFYATLIGLPHLDADTLVDAYFASRAASDAFEHARANLEESRENAKRRRTVAWRYALLRMHDAVSLAVPHLEPVDRDRFDRGLRRMFADNYAAVPLSSIERLLALHESGVLRVERIGPHDRFRPRPQGVALIQRKATRDFTTLIDARGQRRLGVADLPFPTLRGQLGGRDEPMPIGPAFGLTPPGGAAGTVHCAAIPYLLHRNPFVQGIVEAARIAQTVAEDIGQHQDVLAGRMLGAHGADVLRWALGNPDTDGGDACREVAIGAAAPTGRPPSDFLQRRLPGDRLRVGDVALARGAAASNGEDHRHAGRMGLLLERDADAAGKAGQAQCLP